MQPSAPARRGSHDREEEDGKGEHAGGRSYRSADPELAADRRRAERLLTRDNATSGEGADARTALLRESLDSVGEGAIIQPTSACDYGYNSRPGRSAFINCNCIFPDRAPIEIGDDLQLGRARPSSSARPGIRRSRSGADPG